MKLNLGLIVVLNSFLKLHKFVINVGVKYFEGRNLSIR
jgi:hypothetical protein